MMRTRHPIRLTLQPLEVRDNPAGTINATFAFGSLTLVGDGLDNGLDIAQLGDGRLELRGTNATQIQLNGAPPVNTVTLPNLLSGALTANLAGGSDQLQVLTAELPGPVTINGGAGNNTVVLNETRVRGSVSIVHGLGFDTTRLTGTVATAGGLTIASGPGGSRVEGDGQTDLRVAGALTITGGAGDDEIALGGQTRLTFGRVLVNGGGGVNLTDMAAGGGLTVARSILVMGGAGVDDVRLQGATMAVGGGITLSLGAGANGASIVGGGGGLSVGGAVTITATRGRDGVQIGSQTVPTAIGGGVALNLGAGGGNATIEGSRLTVGGSVRVAAGAGTESVTVRSLVNDGVIGGDLSVGLGTGDGQTVAISALANGTMLSVGGALRVSTADNTPATGGDSINLLRVGVRRGTVVTTAAGTDNVNINDSSFSSFALGTGAGADVVEIERSPSGGTTRFAGPVRVATGDGNDSVLVGAGVVGVSQAVFGGLNVWNGGPGDSDSIVLQSTLNLFFAPQPVIVGFENES